LADPDRRQGEGSFRHFLIDQSILFAMCNKRRLHFTHSDKPSFLVVGSEAYEVKHGTRSACTWPPPRKSLPSAEYNSSSDTYVKILTSATSLPYIDAGLKVPDEDRKALVLVIVGHNMVGRLAVHLLCSACDLGRIFSSICCKILGIRGYVAL